MRQCVISLERYKLGKSKIYRLKFMNYFKNIIINYPVKEYLSSIFREYKIRAYYSHCRIFQMARLELSLIFLPFPPFVALSLDGESLARD